MEYFHKLETAQKLQAFYLNFTQQGELKIFRVLPLEFQPVAHLLYLNFQG
jgi:hypothetical protein